VISTGQHGLPWLAIAFAVVGVYRLQDLVLASLDNVFGLTMRGEVWKLRANTGPVILALWNIVQVIVIFALFYQTLAIFDLCAFEAPGHEALPSGSFNFLYLSWTTLFPPSSGYVPMRGLSQGLVLAQSATGLLLVGLTLAALISRLTEDRPADDRLIFLSTTVAAAAQTISDESSKAAQRISVESIAAAERIPGGVFAKTVFWSVLASAVAGFFSGMAAAALLSS